MYFNFCTLSCFDVLKNTSFCWGESAIPWASQFLEVIENPAKSTALICQLTNPQPPLSGACTPGGNIPLP